MRNLKRLAIILAVCMIVSVMPCVSFAADTVSTADSATDTPTATEAPTTDPTVTAEPDATAAPEVTAEPTADPDVTADPSATATPEVTADPDATATPEATTDPNATATPEPTATATASSSYSISVYSDYKNYLTPSVTAAPEGKTVTVTGRIRGYNFTSVYYDTEDKTRESLVSSSYSDNEVSTSFEMPASDITLGAETEEMTASEIYKDASSQYSSVKSDISDYETTYVDNSSNYSSSLIKELKSLISDAETQLSSLSKANSALDTAIDEDTVDGEDKTVVNAQEDLDEITDDIEEVVDELGGDDDLEYYDIDISVGKGVKVTISGQTSETINAISAAKTEYIEDVEYDSSESLVFTLTYSSNYSLSSFKANSKVLANSGTKVTLKASQVKNYVSDGILTISISTVYSSSSNSSSGSSSGGTTYYGGTTTATATPDAITGTVGSSDIFTDLDSVEWAKESILALYNLGIVNGMGDGTFAPQDAVTREQFAKMIVGVMGYTVDESATTSFSDDTGDWYTPYLAAATEHGLITGRDDGTFGVGDNITRQDIAVIIHRAMESPAVEIHEFPDSSDISDYAIEAVSYLYVQGIASGDDNGYFNPQNNATRAEASKMLYGLYNIK